MEVKINKSIVPLYKQKDGNASDLWLHTKQIWWMDVSFQTCHSSAASVTAWVFLWSDSSYLHFIYVLFSAPAQTQQRVLPEGQAEVWWTLWEWHSAVGPLHAWELQNEIPMAASLLSLILMFFDMCALSKLIICCHQYLLSACITVLTRHQGMTVYVVYCGSTRKQSLLRRLV